ncbi:MAG: hypothetical protein K6E63_12045 [Lachnospiraceae bacterium]|nr:hypothetical protein [Lachnospiraceae bacterium]
MREEHQEKLFKISENSKGDTEYVEIKQESSKETPKEKAKEDTKEETKPLEPVPEVKEEAKEDTTVPEVKTAQIHVPETETVVETDARNEASPEQEDEVEITEYSDDDVPKEEETYEERMAELSEERKDIGFISVSMGEGMESIFKGLGVDEVISGGQTMNPSTEDMLKAVSRINADNIFILPNNKNIIMAANQVQYMSDDKKIYVIPTKTVPQGITALINYTIGMSADDNDKAMKESIAGVKTGQVTYAVRDTVVNGLSIKRGNIMGIGDKDILSIGDSVHDTSIAMIEKMVDDSSELISIYYGRDTDPQDADEFNLDVAVRFPKCDVEMHYGGQPIYYYVISVE